MKIGNEYQNSTEDYRCNNGQLECLFALNCADNERENLPQSIKNHLTMMFRVSFHPKQRKQCVTSRATLDPVEQRLSSAFAFKNMITERRSIFSSSHRAMARCIFSSHPFALEFFLSLDPLNELSSSESETTAKKEIVNRCNQIMK